MDADDILDAAFALDKAGRESEAIPLYEQALVLGLRKSRRLPAYVGLGSSYRNIGDYENSLHWLDRGAVEFPGYHVLPRFQALAHRGCRPPCRGNSRTFRADQRSHRPKDLCPLPLGVRRTSGPTACR
ncbi:tetratricopeptide repeat protein [Acidihalobacter prosperus]|uniref:tetratricopeptide repeat protein n=1 Tax=Acidihalobacter prosperus TaxID=160660 RepID=UPI000505CDFE|nr:tetratricopeptide repeat protein [Acidihalobacter prosperus]